MKNLKFYLMALTAIFLIGCGDSRAEGKAKIAEEELKLGGVTEEEAECIADLYSDHFSDDEEWAVIVSMYDYTMEEQYEIGFRAGQGEALTAEEQKMVDVSLAAMAVVPKMATECDIDFYDVVNKRMQ